MRTNLVAETRRRRTPARSIVHFNADAEMVRPAGGKVQLRAGEIKGANFKNHLIGEGADEESAVYELCQAVLRQWRSQGSPSLQHALALSTGAAAVRMSFKLSVLGCTGVVPAEALATVYKKSTAERTIGISWPHGVQAQAKELAEQTGRPVSDIARRAFISGLTQLDQRLENEASAKVLASYQGVVDQFEVRPTARFMLRLNRKEHGEAVLLARELRMSLSQLAVHCIAWSLVCDPRKPLLSVSQETSKAAGSKATRKKASTAEHD